MNFGEYIIEKNNQYLVVNKPPGISTQPDKSTDKALTDLAAIYCKHPVHAVHRLDRPVSGVVILAKTAAAMTKLTEQFQKGKVEKTYWAAVRNRPADDTAHLRHYVLYNKKNNQSTIVPEGTPQAMPVELQYTLIASSDHYHLLEIKLITGKKHQIRAQMAAIGSPIKGDVKYGDKRGNENRSIHLHAVRIAFNHPVTGVRVHLSAPPPKEDSVWAAFHELLK